MTAIIRPARPDDCAAVAEAVRRLAVDTHAPKVPAVTPEDLEARAFGPAPLLRLWLAEAHGVVVGILVGVVTFSTWRGGPGLYVCDLWVDARLRGGRLGARLLAAAARAGQAEGLGFMKLEITGVNAAVAKFYHRLGFREATGETLWTLEAAELAALAATEA